MKERAQTEASSGECEENSHLFSEFRALIDGSPQLQGRRSSKCSARAPGLLLTLLAFLIPFAGLVPGALATDQGTVVFGPETFVRHPGQPQVETRSFSGDKRADYLMHVTNGYPDGRFRSDSARVTVNGKKVVRPRDLNENVYEFFVPVSLNRSNKLEARITSQPCSFLTISIFETERNHGRLGELESDSDCEEGSGGLCLQEFKKPKDGDSSDDNSGDDNASNDDGSDDGSSDDNSGGGGGPGGGCSITPVANAGPDQSLIFGNTVTLDGSGSTDVDGDLLSYAWTLLSVPAGSTAVLNDPTAVMPQFFADVPGEYVAQLIVSDGNFDSAPDTVVVSTANTPPVADAGLDQTVPVGTTTTVFGGASYDANGDALSYAWSLLSAPTGSGATLTSPNDEQTGITVDVAGEYVIQLIVNDGYDDSAPDRVTITTSNTPPVADAGGPYADVEPGDVVALDGTFSFDVDNDPLTYFWSILSKPDGSTATLAEALSAAATLATDLEGLYVVQLMVNDGQVDSEPNTATIAAVLGNQPPTAVAGANSTMVSPGTTVQLDGSASSDPENDMLTYQWSLARPDGSVAALSSDTAESPSFTADVEGTYVATLVVNDGEFDSAPTSVSITASVTNNPPTAVAGANSTMVSPGANVQLDGSASSDPEDDMLTYQWSLTRPDGSAAALSSATAESPSFTADVEGTYVATLVVNDGEFDSAPSSVSITASVSNNPPRLAAIGNRVMFLGGTLNFRLFGIDPDVGDTLTYSLPTVPENMGINPTTGDVSFTPNATQLGLNNVTARVIDDGGLSDMQSFTIEVRQALPIQPQNSPPTLAPISNVTVIVGNALGIQMVASDPDAGDTLTYSLRLAPAGMTISATGLIQFTPVADQAGQHDVTVQVADDLGAVALQSFIVTVKTINRPPLAFDDLYDARIGETTSISAPGVLGNDSDPDGDALAAALVSDVSNGVLDFRPDGSFDYTPGLPEVESVDIELEQYCLTPKMDAIANSGVSGQLAVGDVDNDGVSEIVGMVNARIFVMNGETCELEYQMDNIDVNNDGLFPDSTAHIGLVDLDGDGDLEIIVKTGFTSTAPFFFGQDVHGHLIAYHHDGTLVWNRAVATGEDARFGNITPLIRNPAHPTAQIGDWRNAGPTFADLDADGTPEIIIGFFNDDTSTGASAVGVPGVVAFNGNDGSIKWLYFGDPTGDLSSAGRYSMVHVADLDLDGTPEVVYEGYVLDHNGVLEHTMPLDDLSFGTIPFHVESAVANFDDDEFAEVLVRHKQYFYLFEHDGTRKWKRKFTDSASIEDSIDRITVADFDGDGEMEFTHRMTERSNENFAGFARYQVVYENDGTVLWSHEVNPEYYSNPFIRPQAVTAFDVNQDGADDIIANLRIDALTDDPVLGLGNAVLMAFSGKDGTELFRARAYADSANSVFPVIVDLDDDGEAEILISGIHPLNTFASSFPSFFIYRGTSSSPLPPAPVISNQWSFNAAYVNDDGSIPANPTPHWLNPGQNGFHKVSAPDKVYTQLKCETVTGSFGLYDNATLAVGDVDNDGDIEIVGSSFISSSLNSELWLLNADDCTPQAVPNVADMNAAGAFSQGSHHGLLDIDGDGDLEIIGIRAVVPGVSPDGDHLLAVHHDGSLVTEWNGDGVGVSETIALNNMIGNSSAGGFSQMGPTFADLDANGTVEIIMPWYSAGLGGGTIRGGMTVFNSADGSIAWEYLMGELQYGDSDYKPPLVADIDLDGTMEIIYHNYVFDHTGGLEFLLPVQPSSSYPTHLATAVANFDDDPYAEIIAIDQDNHYLFNHDGSVIFQRPLSNNSGSQITVADFDGDLEVEYAWYNGLGSTQTLGFFEVYDTDGSLLWSHQGLPEFGEELTRFKGVNATAFDANNDGAFDLVVHLDVYSPQDPSTPDGVYIFDGRDGSVLNFMPIRSASTEQRFTTIADIDNDGEAEIISSFTNGLAFATRIWEGATSHPLPLAPKHRNQWIFNEAYADADGNTLSKPVPHWLQPGLNGYNMIKRPPDPLAGTVDSFTYVANDGVLNSNTATVSFDVQPAGLAPVFLTQPDTLTTVGFPYEYAPRVVDPDPGDSVSFTLAAAPAGMTMAANGRLSWLPDAEGSFQVSIIASDTIGFATPQSFTLIVGQPVVVPDVVGQPQAAAESTLTGVNLLTGTVSTSTHPTIAVGSVFEQTPIAGSVAEFGGEVDLRVSTGPAPEDMDDDGDGFSETQGDCNDANDAVYPGAADAPGDGIDQDCDGIDGNLVLSGILVSPATSTVLTNQAVALTATGIFEDGTSQNLTGVVSWANGPTFSSATAGNFTVTASRGGIDATATVNVVNRVAGDTVPPQVEITAPANNSTVTEPVDVIGTASDANFLKYTLAYAPAGEENFTTIVTSTTPVTAGVLGQFDPTLLLNDLYTIRLTVFDAGGNQTIAETTVQVDGQQKVGNYTITFTDLQIPMAGLPIAITRTYDSRDKSRGDFGIGWNLNLRTITIRTNRVLGTGWQVDRSGLSFSLSASDAHKVSIVMPGGRVEEFDLVIAPTASPLVPFPASSLSARFVARPGSLGTLQSLDNNALTIFDQQPGVVSLADDLTGSPYNPRRFRYTAVNGVQFVVDRTNGLESITDANGNAITFSDSGITHSGGRSVTFVRDDLGRINQIVDPGGNQYDYTYDANGDLTRYTDAESNESRYLYNRSHGLIEARDPLGNRAVRNEYDDDGRLTAMIDAGGNRVEFTHNIAGNEEIQTDQRGFITRFIYDDGGNVLSKEKTITIEGVPVVALELFEYDDRDLQTAYVDADGVRTETTYDANENVTRTVVDPGGLNITSSAVYNDEGLLVSKTDALGEVTSFTFGSNRNLTAVTDPLSNTRRIFYDSFGRIVALEDAAGTVTANEFDSFGHQISRTVTDAAGNLTAKTGFSYDTNGKQAARSEYRYVDGVLMPFTTAYTLDALGRRTRITDPLGNASVVEYDAAGQVLARIDANGNRTEFTYDQLGRQTEIDYADTTSASAAYDAVGNLVQTTDALGRVTTYTYDEMQRRLTTTRPDLSVIENVYTPGGRLSATIDAKGQRTEFVYDTAGRQTQVILPEVLNGRDNSLIRPTQTLTYDAAGRQTRRTDANGNTTIIEYDAIGRPTRTTFPDNTSSLQIYDEVGRLTALTNEQGQTTRFTYDSAGQLLTVTQPSPDGIAAQPVTTYAYDLGGRRLSQMDAMSRTTRFEYDAAGRRIAKLLPGGQALRATYDPAGNVETQTDANGGTTTFIYDDRNRISSRTYPSGDVASFTYTLNGSLKTATDASGTLVLEYDVMDRVTSITNPAGVELTYDFDDNGNLTLVASGAQSVSYAWDSLNRLLSANDNSGITSYLYDPNGNQVSIVRPNNASTEHVINNINRVSSVIHRDSAGVILERFDYTFLANGLRNTITELDGSVENYVYDNLDRLVSETRTGSSPRSVSYQYDLVGNRTQIDDGSGAQSYTYGVNDQLLSAGTTTFTYDANGSRTSRNDGSTVIYTWDDRNRLANVASAGSVITYGYDVNGNRISRSDPAGTVNYVVDNQSITGLSQVAEERTATDDLIAAYSYGNDLLNRNDGNADQYHVDAHGSTQLLTGVLGTEVASYNYDGYGNLTGGSGASDNEYLYTGERYDPASDLHYLRARYYDSRTGTLLSRDPFEGNLGVPISLQPYLYAANNPTNLVDPTGRTTLVELNISQLIDASLRTLSVGARACSFISQAQTAVGAVELLQLGFAIAGSETNLGIKTSSEVDMPSKFRPLEKVTFEATKDTFKLAFGFEDEDDDDVNLEVAFKNGRVNGVKGSLSGSVDKKLASLTYCGLEIGELKALVELETALGAGLGDSATESLSGYTTESGFTVGGSGQLKAAFELSFGSVAIEAPLFVVTIGGSKAGISVFSVPLSELF